jgi:hypothetical protein
VAACRKNEDERIRADIVGNTFDARPADGVPKGFGIYAAPSFNSGQSTKAWLDLNVKFNEFNGYELALRLHNRRIIQIWNFGYGVTHANIDASYNYWGTHSQESVPADDPSGTIHHDILEDTLVTDEWTSELTYTPWLINRKYSGHEGPYGRRTLQLPTLPSSFSLSTEELSIYEHQTAQFEVELDVIRSYDDDVEVDFTSINPDLSFEPAPVVFTSENRGEPQTVSAYAAPDRDFSDETTEIVATSEDGSTATIEARIIDAGVQDYHYINKLEPSVKEVNIGGGERIRLGIVPYGRQNIVDNALIDGKTGVIWSVEGGNGSFKEAEPGLDEDSQPNDREIIFTSPTEPGTYQIHATLASCGHDVALDCRATFTVHVLRGSVSTEPKPEPVNPTGEIPSILADSDGNQYEVFTPTRGGAFAGESSSLKAGPGAVPNGEIVGLRIVEGDLASNEGKTHHRYTLGGNWHEITAVDASGEPIASYALNEAIEVCVPLPDALRTNISDLAIVAVNPDDSLTTLSGQVRIVASGIEACGKISSLPASLAVGSAGAPAPIPTAAPEPDAADELPDTGGTAPLSTYRWVWALLIGLVSLALGLGVLRAKRRRI